MGSSTVFHNRKRYKRGTTSEQLFHLGPVFHSIAMRRLSKERAATEETSTTKYAIKKRGLKYRSRQRSEEAIIGWSGGGGEWNGAKDIWVSVRTIKGADFGARRCSVVKGPKGSFLYGPTITVFLSLPKCQQCLFFSSRPPSLHMREISFLSFFFSEIKRGSKDRERWESVSFFFTRLSQLEGTGWRRQCMRVKMIVYTQNTFFRL